jgi:hypothetical protein
MAVIGIGDIEGHKIIINVDKFLTNVKKFNTVVHFHFIPP